MRNTFEAKGNAHSVTNDDTRDVSILIVRRLMDLGYIEDNDDYYFDIQDTCLLYTLTLPTNREV